MALQPPSVSVARARATHTVRPGQCLHYVWTYLDGEHTYGLPDANAAYKATQRLHKSSTPPAGVPGYVLGSEHGHVVLMLGGWQCWSTDWPRRGVASEVDVRVLARTWGRTWAGWAEDVAGHQIPGITSTQPTGDPPMIPKDVWWWDGIAAPTPNPDPKNPTWRPMSYLRETYQLLVAVRSELAGLRRAVAALAATPDLTAQQISDAAKAGSAAALDERISSADVTLSVTPPGGQP